MTRRMILLAIVSAMMLIVAACDDLEAERVDDDPADDVAVEQADDAADDAETDDAVTTDDDGTTDDDVADEPASDDATEDDDVADDAAEEDDDAAVEESDDAEMEEAEGFVVGDTVRMGELVMRLHSVRWDTGDEFFGPDEGTRWLVADIEIENEADSPTSISSIMMFDLVDEDNRTRDIELMADTEGSLDGELGAGRSMRGDIAWEVRDDQTEWELIFTPQLFGFGQAIFDITEADFE